MKTQPDRTRAARATFLDIGGIVHACTGTETSPPAANGPDTPYVVDDSVTSGGIPMEDVDEGGRGLLRTSHAI